jgi:hypothetical protein
MSLAEQFNDNGYLVYNYVFSAVCARGYRHGALNDELAEMLPKPADETEFTAWLRKATTQLVERLIEQVKLGCVPPFSPVLYRKQARFRGVQDDLFKIAAFLCTLPVDGLNGAPVPKSMARIITHPAILVDIVPVDPRQGWHDIPDWQDVR